MSQQNRYKIGELRPSQLMHSFGVGSVVDFPNISGMVMGLEEWDTRNLKEQITEERLLGAIRERLGRHIKFIYRPPVNIDDNPFSFEAKIQGIPIRTFPSWIRCPLCGRMAQHTDPIVRFKANAFRPDKMQYEHTTCDKAKTFSPTMIPVRRLVACSKGHMDDFPWMHFVHKGETSCKGPLYWREYGVTGNPGETFIECMAKGCNSKRSLLEAFGPKGQESLPDTCNANHPHLRKSFNNCEAESKPIVLGASNSWFSMTLSVISVPAADDELEDLIAENWSNLENAISLEVLIAFRNAGMLSAFGNYENDEILEAIKKRHSNPIETNVRNIRDLKSPEWNMFTTDADEFRHRNLVLKKVDIPVAYAQSIVSIQRVDRLREAQALIGFTRLLSPGEFGDWDEATMEMLAPLSRNKDTDWVPGNEVRESFLNLMKAKFWHGLNWLRLRNEK